jgi:tetraacyldisaccharide 4'-kinase
MKTPAFWATTTFLSLLLLPLSVAYWLTASVRQRLRKPMTLPVPVICVGNLTAGGAGKTPVALAVGEHLKAKGVNAFFLSRGYGGNRPGPLRIDPAVHTASEVGDEPLLLARVLPTIVARDRLAGARLAVAQGARAIVMDDGLQNPSIKKTLSLVVVDGAYGFGNGWLIPAGPLRETVAAGTARADAVIVIGPGQKLPAITGKPVLSARLVAHPEAQDLRGKQVLAFCGIALPQKFFATLHELDAIVSEKRVFADHYPYREEEIESLLAHAQTLDAKAVTTAKDAVRLPPGLRNSVTVIDVTLSFDRPDQLDALIERAMTRA